MLSHGNSIEPSQGSQELIRGEHVTATLQQSYCIADTDLRSSQRLGRGADGGDGLAIFERLTRCSLPLNNSLTIWFP